MFTDDDLDVMIRAAPIRFNPDSILNPQKMLPETRTAVRSPVRCLKPK